MKLVERRFTTANKDSKIVHEVVDVIALHRPHGSTDGYTDASPLHHYTYLPQIRLWQKRGWMFLPINLPREKDGNYLRVFLDTANPEIDCITPCNILIGANRLLVCPLLGHGLESLEKHGQTEVWDFCTYLYPCEDMFAVGAQLLENGICSIAEPDLFCFPFAL